MATAIFPLTEAECLMQQARPDLHGRELASASRSLRRHADRAIAVINRALDELAPIEGARDAYRELMEGLTDPIEG